tara:strand:- start:1211 stop:1396 length:186 start_codon:yes stop_codon:yes gene_type:complete
MTEQNTITAKEHFVLVDYYQNLIKKKDKEIEFIKNNLQFTLQAKDLLEAKLEVTNNNLMHL